MPLVGPVSPYFLLIWLVIVLSFTLRSVLIWMINCKVALIKW